MLGVHAHLVVLGVHRDRFDAEKLVLHSVLVRLRRRKMLDKGHLAALDVALNAHGRAHVIPAAAGVLQEIELFTAAQLHQYRRPAGLARDLRPPARVIVGRHHALRAAGVERHALEVPAAGAGHSFAHGVPRGGGLLVGPFLIGDRRRFAGAFPQGRAGVRPVQIHLDADEGVFDGLLRHRRPDDVPGHQVLPFPRGIDGVRHVDLAGTARHHFQLALRRDQHHKAVIPEMGLGPRKHGNGLPVPVVIRHRIGRRRGR